MLGAVVAGGVIGVAARELVLLPFSTGPAADPGALEIFAATAAVNVAGSFALGIVVGLLGDRRPVARAFLGAGVLGGFTTYSAFAVQTATLAGSAPVAGFALALVCVVLGIVAAGLGVRLADGRGRGEQGAGDGREAAP